MSTENIKYPFIKQLSCSPLWQQPPVFETMRAMVSNEEFPESTQSVAKRLRLTRQAFGMKKAVWCRFVGISPQAWNNVEGSDSGPAANRISVDEALKVCRATGVGLNWIFRGDRADIPLKIAVELQKLDPPAKRKVADRKA